MSKEQTENEALEMNHDSSTSPNADLSAMANESATSIDGFNPAIHAVGPDGQPKRRGDGSYAMKRGRKPGQKAATIIQPGAGMVAPTDATRETISNDEAARQVCNVVVGGAVALIGAEWQPIDKAEADGLRLGVKNYFDAKGQINLPPEIGLAMAVLAYSLPRFQHENTKSKALEFLRALWRGAKNIVRLVRG